MNRTVIRVAFAALLVALATVWLHWPSVDNGFLLWDDNEYLGKARELSGLSFRDLKQTFTIIYTGNYLPLTWLSHAIDCRLWGMKPAPHHATNVVLHGLNTALVVALAWMFTGAGSRVTEAERLAIAAGVGLVFGFHPLQVESVAWISERKNLLCGLFSLGCLCTYVSATRGGAPAALRWITVLLFLAALLSKPMAVSLPLVMLAMDYYPLRRYASVGRRRLVAEKAPLIVLTVLLCAVTLYAQTNVGSVVDVGRLSVLDRVLLAVRGIVFYLWKLLWPAWLSPYYPLQGGMSLSQREFLTGAAAFILVTAISVSARRRAPALLAAWLAYLALILPPSGLVQVGGQAAADRYMYLAMLPPLFLAACGCVWLWRNVGAAGRSALAVLLACMLAYDAVRTREQIAWWHDDESLWTAALIPFPNSLMVNLQLSRALARNEKWDEAIAFAQRGVVLEPGFAAPHADLGALYLLLHRYGEAVMELETALRIQPRMALGQYNLACAYSQTGHFAEAFDTLRELLAVEASYGRFASQDPELTDLRAHPEYASRVRDLLRTPEGE